ncbi:H-2 class II histocompatibility antigen, E-S beta chain-like isoform X1 [Brachyistius frenatus]|uniref:H-2 class II histocompatibility antigen, E-S beta chain-like isoform X1 n=1 Tax=Brachyistius frenatus TaxID=100188 RepID=UPI0037E91F48
MTSSLLSCCLLFLTVCPTDGFLEYVLGRCEFNITDVNKAEFIYSSFYNRKEQLRYSSSLGKYVGFTAYGVKNAERANNDTGALSQMKANTERFCRFNAGIWKETVLSKSVSPSVRLSSSTSSSGRHPSMLVCSVYDFFPKQIQVSWLRDGQKITSDVTSTEELADGDWYYQVHSELEYTPRSGEKISCVVEHASLDKPLITDWDPSMPESERNKIAIGASGLVLGLILSLAGFIYYKRKAQGRILVPTN